MKEKLIALLSLIALIFICTCGLIKSMQLEPQALINYLVQEITLFKDRIEIHFKTPLKESPENDRGFSFGEKRIRFSYENSFKREIIYVQFEIEMYVS